MEKQSLPNHQLSLRDMVIPAFIAVGILTVILWVSGVFKPCHCHVASAVAASAAKAHDVAPPGAVAGSMPITTVEHLPTAPLIEHSNSRRFWAVLDKGTLWTTTEHQKAHERFTTHPGSIVWQMSVPQSHGVSQSRMPSMDTNNVNSCGTNLFGIVLCK